MSDPECAVQAFLAAGHVCTIMGTSEYYPLVDKYQIPIVITGFEPVDLLQGILMTIKQLESGEAQLENQYSRMVREDGNLNAIQVVQEVFEIADRQWRGMSVIPESGYTVREEYRMYDANIRFDIHVPESSSTTDCIAGDIMKGNKKPVDCPNFGKACVPESPIGAPMVSSEGACAAYYHFANMVRSTTQIES